MSTVEKVFCFFTLYRNAIIGAKKREKKIQKDTSNAT
jgi:hypothetical protein